MTVQINNKIPYEIIKQFILSTMVYFIYTCIMIRSCDGYKCRIIYECNMIEWFIIYLLVIMDIIIIKKRRTYNNKTIEYCCNNIENYIDIYENWLSSF